MGRLKFKIIDFVHLISGTGEIRFCTGHHRICYCSGHIFVHCTRICYCSGKKCVHCTWSVYYTAWNKKFSDAVKWFHYISRMHCTNHLLHDSHVFSLPNFGKIISKKHFKTQIIYCTILTFFPLPNFGKIISNKTELYSDLRPRDGLFLAMYHNSLAIP